MGGKFILMSLIFNLIILFLKEARKNWHEGLHADVRRDVTVLPLAMNCMLNIYYRD